MGPSTLIPRTRNPEQPMSAVAIAQAPVASDRHITAAEIGRLYPYMTRTRLYRLVVGGSVRVDLPPGMPPRYNLADVERIMAERGE